MKLKELETKLREIKQRKENKDKVLFIFDKVWVFIYETEQITINVENKNGSDIVNISGEDIKFNSYSLNPYIFETIQTKVHKVSDFKKSDWLKIRKNFFLNTK